MKITGNTYPVKEQLKLQWKLSKSEVEAYIGSRLAELGEDDA